MPRPKKPGSAEPKKRSRNGCWPCKNRKIKCGEERPKCQNCERQGEACDYSIRLNWEGRTKKKGSNENQSSANTALSPPTFSRATSNESSKRGSSVAPSDGFINNQYGGQSYAGMPPAQLSPYRDQMSTAQLGRIRDQGGGPYPSPADSSIESPPLMSANNVPYTGHYHSQPNPEMPPPFQSPPFSLSHFGNMRASSGTTTLMEHKAKKMRLSPSVDAPDLSQRNQLAVVSLNLGPLKSPMTAPYQSSSPSNGTVRLPPTPAASSVGSEDSRPPVNGSSSQPIQESADFRRLSVKSLLSDDSPGDSGSGSENVWPGILNIGAPNNIQKTVYGIDRGVADRDLPKNNDMIALDQVTPTLATAGLDRTYGDSGNDDLISEFGFGLNAVDDFSLEPVGYYANPPVTVSISKSLEPLPAVLQDNPMNLLYFHHFLNHTARILVPHDCSENPFKSILPQMAIQDTNLLSLLLSYSASHRSKLLNHPEPSNRIAHWVQDVFPALRRALDNPSQISNSNLATAILLASLEIISPNTFEVSVSWQTHLNVARQMILARKGANSVHRKDKVSWFLTRWFAYLDVLGSLSGTKYGRPLYGGDYWVNDTDGEEIYQVDCLLGFTSRCVSILAKIAELAGSCDSQRIDSYGNVDENWQPAPYIVEAAENLKLELQEARMHRYQGCTHRRASTQVGDNSSYAIELVTTNDAYHWAGLIHVDRRVLGKSSRDVEVQFAVREIVSALYKVRQGGAAEGCLLFPMFTAGCDAQEQRHRDVIMDRLRSVEASGMTQVRKARTLIELVWETGRPWETLVTEEFLG